MNNSISKEGVHKHCATELKDGYLIHFEPCKVAHPKPKHEHQWHYVGETKLVGQYTSISHKFICVCGKPKVVEEQTNNEGN